MKLHLKALALSAALLAGGVTLLMGIWFVATGYGTPVFEKLSQVMSLYSVFVTFTYDPLLSFVKNLKNNVVSLVVLTVLSSLDAGLLAWLFGLLYNAFLPKNTKG
ncbi:MAG: hypothetical protein N2314_02195 [Brevinematales bacterium]|nr:hypothetical protein [Brevinematales bacterium]